MYARPRRGRDRGTVAGVELRPASALRRVTRRAFRRHRDRIIEVVPEAEIHNTGGTSIPSTVTRGDLDIHVRVPPEAFGRAVAALALRYRAYRPEQWTDEFATFEDARAKTPPVGVALTAIGGEHDERFVRGWQRLATDPRLVDEYNALKSRHVGDAVAYETAKSAFFSRLVAPGARSASPDIRSPDDPGIEPPPRSPRSSIHPPEA